MPKQVIVVGAGQGGLSAAVYARLHGHEVLVLEQHDAVGGKAASIETHGFRLDPGPSIVILPRIYDRVFRDAGRELGDYLQFERLDPFSRIYSDFEEPLDLPAEREECLRLLKSRFPSDAAAFETLMRKLDRVSPLVDATIFKRPYNRVWDFADRRLIAFGLQFDMRRTYRQLIDTWFNSPLLKSFFYGFPSYGGQSYDSKAPGALLIPYYMIQDGVYYPTGGVASITQAFMRLAKELGVEFQLNRRITGLKHQRNRVTSVQTDQGELSCDALISNLDRLTLGTWLGRDCQVDPSFSYFTVHWGIRRRIEGLSHHTLLVPREFEMGFEDLYKRRQFPKIPIVYLNATNIVDVGTAPENCTNLFAVCTSPAEDGVTNWERQKDEFRNRVKDQLHRFDLDFSEDEIIFERIQTPQYFRESHGNYRGSLYGPDEKHRLFGMLPLRNYDEDYENLFYCGGSVQPGAGLPMVTLSGKFAAQLV